MVNLQFSARFEKYFVPFNPVNFLPFYALAFLSVYGQNTVFAISFSPLTCNWQKYFNLVGGAKCNKTRGASCNWREMRSVHFMPVIASDSFQMSKTKLKVAPCQGKHDNCAK